MNNSKRIMAGVASLAMLAGVVAAFPVQPEKVNAADDVIFSADFEDGKEDGFSRRGEDETVEVVTDDAHGGKNSPRFLHRRARSDEDYAQHQNRTNSRNAIRSGTSTDKFCAARSNS